MSCKNNEHILFLTGKLAEKPLQRVLKEMDITEFSYEILNININVAALMTASMITRRLEKLKNLTGVNKIIVPGLCMGDLSIPSKELGIPFLRGPIDLKDLPNFFGKDNILLDLSNYEVDIFAEIVDAPNITVEEIILKAQNYRNDGANVIDIGCLPDTPFSHLEDTINSLHSEGFKVSIDSLDERELLRGGRAGADYLLSLKESSLWIADEVDSIPVIIPESNENISSFFNTIEKIAKKRLHFYADPILDPIHFGFTESIVRYSKLRDSYPDIKIMMGIGNITELTEADTTGINAILFGLISEMRLNAVLLTQVSKHCCSVVREADKARRIMSAAKKLGRVPKGLDDSLLGMHARKPFSYSKKEIFEIYDKVKDPNYRVQVSDTGVYVYNRDGIHSGYQPFDFFNKLEDLHKNASHAFYMGVELAKAQIAWQLGKRYIQDQELNWGACVKEKDKT